MSRSRSKPKSSEETFFDDCLRKGVAAALSAARSNTGKSGSDEALGEADPTVIESETNSAPPASGGKDGEARTDSNAPVRGAVTQDKEVEIKALDADPVSGKPLKQPLSQGEKDSETDINSEVETPDKSTQFQTFVEVEDDE